MQTITVSTQAELNAALKLGDVEIVIDRDGYFYASVYTGSPIIRVAGRTNITVEAWGSSDPHLVVTHGRYRS